MCGQHNVRASAEDNTGQNIDKGHTPNPRTEIKIPDPAGNRTRAAGLEGRDSTNHATATDGAKNLLRENTKITISSLLQCTNNTLLIQVGRSVNILLITLQNVMHYLFFWLIL